MVNSEKNTWYKCSEGYIFSDYVQEAALYYATTSLNSATLKMYKSTSKTIKATVKGPSKTVTWKSSDTSVASVDKNGKVTAKKAGTCTITASANKKKATCKVTVVNPELSLNATKLTVYTSGTKKLVATVKGPSGSVSWKSKDAKIATVDKNGKVTPKKVGVCKITATANGVTKTCTVTVKKPSITLDINSRTLDCNQSVQITATVNDNKKTTVTWSSNNKSVATVNSAGVVTASGNKSANGKTCTITATANGLKATCIIKVVSKGDESTQKVNYVIDKVSGSTTIKYDSAWFGKDSKIYNENISKLSSQLVMLGYADGAAVKNTLEKMGFKDVVQVKDTDRNEVNYYMAHKIIYIAGKPYNLLVAGFIGSYYHQWYSNFDPYGKDRTEDGDKPGSYAGNSEKGKVHLGFADAREFIYERLNGNKEKGIEAYINKLAKDPKTNQAYETKVFLAGHSRGAATANLLGAKLIKEQKLGSLSLKRTNIFTYTFATPNVATKSHIQEQTTSSGMYSGIFNIVNPEDFVTEVLPEKWGYSRYGTTYSLPDNTKYLSAMKTKFSELSTTKGYKKYPDGSKTVNAIIKAMCEKVKNVDEMYSKKFESYYYEMSVYSFFKKALCPAVVSSKTRMTSEDKAKKEEAEGFMIGQCFDTVLGTESQKNSILTKIAIFFVKNQGVGSATEGWIFDTYFSDAHCAQTYCAYMLSLDSTVLQSNKK